MEMRREAADEIERLRRELDHWKAVACDCLETREPSALSPSHQPKTPPHPGASSQPADSAGGQTGGSE
jgi:hypothetical protein